MTKEFICIICPVGCHLSVSADGTVTGNTCPRGKAWAMQEVTAPMRTVTTTVNLSGGRCARLPVITSCPVPKEKMMDVVRALAGVSVCAPVSEGQVIVPGIAGTEADIVASCPMEKL